MDWTEFVDVCARDGLKIERLIRGFYSRQDRRDELIDGGAHHGYHTSFAREFFDLVISVEASARTDGEHRPGPIAAGRAAALAPVIPINAALGVRALQGDTVSFFFSPTHPGRNTVNTKFWEVWAKGSVVYEDAITAAVIEVDDLKALFCGQSPCGFHQAGPRR